MPEKTSTASESTLGMMEGLRSYIPNKGWEDLSPEKKEKPKQLQLFDNYVEKLSEKLQTNVQINHRKNQLTISVSYDRFKDYISFLDQLCTIEMNSFES